MIVFDTETTGLPKPSSVSLDKQPKIIEFAAIKLDDVTLEEIDRIDFLCNPREKLDPFIIKLTGITDELLESSEIFTANYENLFNFFLGEKYMAAHNCEFDRTLLRFELARISKVLNFPWPPIHICTVQASMPIKGHRLKLFQLYKIATGKEFKEAHCAMLDVEALVECVRFLVKEGYVLWD